MAAPNTQTLAAAPAAYSAAQQPAAVTAQRSPRGAPAKQGAAMVAPPSPQGAPGFAVVPQGFAHVAAPGSPQGPPGFWVAPQQGATAPPQGAPVMAPTQGATVMAQQQHFAPVLVSGSQQGMQMSVQAASMAMMMASMPLQAQAQAMAAYQPAQGMAPSQSLPVMEMQQAQAGHMMVPPPLPLGPPPLMQQQQQQQPLQADPAIMAQPPLPLGPPPAMLQQQPAQGGSMMMVQPPLPFSPPSVMLQQNPQAQGNQMMMMGQPQLAALPCKRQRVDQYDNNPYGQHMTGHQQETAIFNAAMGQSYGPNLHNEFPSFGAPMPSLPTDATSTLYVEGLPIDCTKREVAHIFRQYMGFREVRLINKGPDRHVMCFVDFATPAHAFLAMRTLQAAVGKTQLLARFTRDEFALDSKSTIGVEFQTRTLTLHRKRVKAQIWDTAGQERYRAVTSAYYRGALGAMVVYDVTRRAAFEHVSRWVEELRAHADGSTVVALIGNKADMPAARREVPADEAARLAEEQGLFFSEASALTGDNVERAFLTLLEEVFAVVSRRALELDEARRMRGDQGGGGGGEVLSLKGTAVDVGSITETSAMKRSSQCACS